MPGDPLPFTISAVVIDYLNCKHVYNSASMLKVSSKAYVNFLPSLVSLYSAKICGVIVLS